MAPKPLLFISHSSKDSDAAEHVKAGLLSDFEIFLDKYDLRAGDDWQQVIETAMVGCDCAVVMLSPAVTAKPEWVAAEAFTFALRQRVLDPDFLVVPVFLPGFTAADLDQGPLSPARFKSIQGVALNPAALDLQPLAAALQPVLETFAPRLPFREVTISLASAIEQVGSNAHEALRQSLNLDANDMKRSKDRARWLAARLLRCDRAALEAAYRALKVTQEAAAKLIFRIAAPYTWVDAGIADPITRAGLAVRPRAPVTMAAARAQTPKFCVRRGSLRASGWEGFDAEAVFGDVVEEDASGTPNVERLLVGNIRRSLARLAGYLDQDSPSADDIEAALDDSPLKDEPVFVFLEPWFADMDGALIATLRQAFPRVVFMIRTAPAGTSVDQKFPGAVVVPPLAPGVENLVYLMYNRCLPGEKLP
jgi:hypothetical protein